MLPLLLLLAVSAAPPPAAPEVDPKKGPPPSELAKLYFLAGDLRKATETARVGAKVDPVKCKAIYPMLVEYEFLLPRADHLTPAEAKAFFEWDRKISPGTPGKLTGPVFRRYVETPLQLARTAAQGDDKPRAAKLVAQVLEVDPANADALALKASLEPADAGVKK